MEPGFRFIVLLVAVIVFAIAAFLRWRVRAIDSALIATGLTLLTIPFCWDAYDQLVA